MAIQRSALAALGDGHGRARLAHPCLPGRDLPAGGQLRLGRGHLCQSGQGQQSRGSGHAHAPTHPCQQAPQGLEQEQIDGRAQPRARAHRLAPPTITAGVLGHHHKLVAATAPQNAVDFVHVSERA